MLRLFPRCLLPVGSPSILQDISNLSVLVVFLLRRFPLPKVRSQRSSRAVSTGPLVLVVIYRRLSILLRLRVAKVDS